MDTDVDILLAKAKLPMEESPGLHKKYRGKVELLPWRRV